jgi:shikimate kinase
MKIKKNLVLIGMMGSGKSTIGSLISKKLDVKFIDVDSVLEDVTKMKIAEIFEKKGENFFRNLEEKITLKLLNSNSNVISLGGGGFINEKIRNEVLKNNLSFWLNCDTQMLLGRIKKNQRRPIAFNLSDSELTELITKRTKIYSKAQFKINCRKLKKTEIVKKILKIYERN